MKPRKWQRHLLLPLCDVDGLEKGILRQAASRTSCSALDAIVTSTENFWWLGGHEVSSTCCRVWKHQQNQHHPMSTNKLHPVYVALDSHQYSRAIKLASSLPETNLLGKALLAHAYYKNGQTVQATEKIDSLLCWEWESATEGEQDDESDIVDALVKDPIPTDFSLLPKNPCPASLADETLLETVAITLQGMRNGDRVYQLYAWVSHHHPSIRHFAMPRQFAAGLHVLVRQRSILTSLQTLALQLSRLSPTYTPWAALTALWKWQHSQTKDDIRIQMLPRLAESLAKKHLDQPHNSHRMQASLLMVQVLKAQSKWTELLEFIKDKDDDKTNIPELQRMEMQAQSYVELEMWQEGQSTFSELLEKQPDQWSWWVSLVDCCVQKGGIEEAYTVVTDLVNKLESSKENLRARSLLLIRCELASRTTTTTAAMTTKLGEALRKYLTTYASRASCAFVDVRAYLTQFLDKGSPDDVDGFVSFIEELRLSSSSEKSNVDPSTIRQLICALQIQNEIATVAGRGQLPVWQEIVKQWKDFPTAESIQKENQNQPSDDIMLIAADRLIASTPGPRGLYGAATLLEMALQKSSHNPYLNIRLMQVYAKLDAYDRAWKIFLDLGIKHIQMDSCIYLVLPLLVQGGLYKRALVVANDILKFHSSTLRESGDFMSRALEAGTWNKADEILQFQHQRMNRSLTLLEAKGVTLDCAPFYGGGSIALHHGIIGGDDDVERVTRMLEEVNNSFGALTILKLKEEDDDYSDNRDLSILPSRLFQPPKKEEIMRDTVRRKFLHGLLVRAVLVVDATKGPKKGKLAKRNPVLISRCESLVGVLGPASGDAWKDVVVAMAKVLVVVGSGMLLESDDSLSAREKQATEFVKEATAVLQSFSPQWTPKNVGLTVPSLLMPAFAVLKIVAKTFALYGWGKRKQRESVSALAELAASLLSVVQQMSSCLDHLMMWDNAETEILDSTIMDSGVWQKVCNHVRTGRNAMRERIKTVLEEISEELATFDNSKTSK